MAAVGTDFVKNLRVDKITKDIMDVRTIPQDLVFLNRLNINPAPNSMLLGKYLGRIQIADLLAPNAPGHAYEAARIYTETVNLQKMKVGTVWSESDLENWMDLKASLINDPEGIFAKGLIRNAVMNQVIGTQWRQEWLAVAMATDGFYGTAGYNRLGFALAGTSTPTPTWGMKPDLKTFVPIPLGNPDGTVNAACPIVDYIFQAIEARKERYGKQTNRITLRTSVKRAIFNTTQFQNMARQWLAPNVSFVNLSLQNVPQMTQLLGRVLAGDNADQEIEVVTYDAHYQSEKGDGTPPQYLPFLPLAPEACMILDDRRNDKNDSIHDFAMGSSMESRFDAMRYTNGTLSDDIPDGPPVTGRPYSYAYVKGDMNPVGLEIWTVAKGWPRKMDATAETVLFLGPLGDFIPVADIAVV